MADGPAASLSPGPVVRGSRNLYGYTIGILMIEGYFPRPPGAIGNATSFPFPVLHKVVPGATSAATVRTLNEHAPGSPAYAAAIAPWLDGARELEREGVRAITSSCGFTALFQRELADSVAVPVFATSLLLAPFIASTLGSRRKVGVVTWDAGNLTARHLDGAGVDPATVALAGLEGCPYFNSVVYGDRPELDLARVDHELKGVVRDLLRREPGIGALLLECSLLPPYAAGLQREFELPVYDFTSMISLVHGALVRTPFPGFL